MAILHISEAAKKGFIRIFSPHSQRIKPLSDAEAWKQNGTVIKNDWRTVGDEIRSASSKKRNATKRNR